MTEVDRDRKAGFATTVLGATVGAVVTGVTAGLVAAIAGRMEAAFANFLFLGVLVGGAAGSVLGAWFLLHRRRFPAAGLTAALVSVTYPGAFFLVLLTFDVVSSTPFFVAALFLMPVVAPALARLIALLIVKLRSP